jgi:hypothetical protein
MQPDKMAVMIVGDLKTIKAPVGALNWINHHDHRRHLGPRRRRAG